MVFSFPSILPKPFGANQTYIDAGRRKWGISAKQRWLQLTPSRTVRRTCLSFASQTVLKVGVPLVGDGPISWSFRSTMSIWCRAYCSHSLWFIRRVFLSRDQAKPLKPHWVLDRRFKLSFVQSWRTLQLKRRFSNIKLVQICSELMKMQRYPKPICASLPTGASSRNNVVNSEVAAKLWRRNATEKGSEMDAGNIKYAQ